jgi:hypothetical protein
MFLPKMKRQGKFDFLKAVGLPKNFEILDVKPD